MQVKILIYTLKNSVETLYFDEKIGLIADCCHDIIKKMKK
jgi:hypothetical protein